MEARAGNSILDFETLFSDFLELLLILNGSGLTPVAIIGPRHDLNMGFVHGKSLLQKSGSPVARLNLLVEKVSDSSNFS